MDAITEKKYYKIKDVAEFLNESQSTLRFWEKEFPQIKPLRTKSGQRYYTASDIEVLKIIKFLLRTKGLKIEAAKDQLRSNSKNISNRVKIMEELQEIKQSLQLLDNALKLRKSKIENEDE